MDRGFEVIGYCRHGSPELAEAGGKLADSAAEVARQSDVLLSIVPDTAAVSDIVCGEAGTLTTLRPGAVHIEMSTIDVGPKSAIRDAVQRSGGDMLDCPISGSPAMVAPRLATTFVSGDEASVAKVRPVLDAISGPWVYTGAFGTGARLKYSANLLLAVHTVAAAEAMELARRSGLDLDLVQRTLDDSIGSSAIWRQRGPLMRERAWSPAPGPIADRGAALRRGRRHRGAARLRRHRAHAAPDRGLACGAQARHARAPVRPARAGRGANAHARRHVAGRRRGPGRRGDDRPPVRHRSAEGHRH